MWTRLKHDVAADAVAMDVARGQRIGQRWMDEVNGVVL